MNEVLDWDAVDLLGAMRAGTVSSEQVMTATLSRIKIRNPSINAIVDLENADALIEAARAADSRAKRGRLHGLPIAIKALENVRGTRNTEGSPLFVNRVASEDAGHVANLRREGAIFIGKTNVPEFGLGSHSYNPVFGVTHNPFAVGRTAGGSSGGAGAALATGMVALADGSDMMGSLRNPAGWNNVYGFRPSWGVIPGNNGTDTFWKQISTRGAMARSPRDLALMMSVMARPDPKVPFNMPAIDWELPSMGRMDGVRIGWLGDWGGALPMEAGILAQCEAGLGVMSDLGAHVGPVKAPFDAEALFMAWSDLRAFSLSNDLSEVYDDPIKRDRLKPEAQWEISRGLKMDARALHSACGVRAQWFRGAADLFTQWDILALPAAQCWPFPTDWSWPKDIAGVAMDTYHRWMHVVVPVSLIGVPAISVPVGFGPVNLPMGVQLFASKGNDAGLLKVAQAYHAATLWPQKYLVSLHDT